MANEKKEHQAAEIKTIADLQKAYPALIEELLKKVKPEEAEIQTIEDMKEAYPDLIKKILDERDEQLKEFFNNRTVEQIKKHFPELYERIAKSLSAEPTILSRKDSFVLEYDDPFAKGVLNLYMQISGKNNLRLPYAVPFKDKQCKRIVENYILRARGGCDEARAKAAEDCLKKCK